MITQSISTDTLEIVYEVAGPEGGKRALLLHGWPDSARAWRALAPRLNARGWRTVAPYLRGFAPTRFLSADVPRVGHAVVLAQDALDLADRLGWDRFAVVGHDWGARIAYSLAALFPERVTRIVALALAYQPRGAFELPSLSQARRFWYQWFMTLDQGAAAVRRDPMGFARLQWETWSPPGWFDETEFGATAQSFTGPDWAAVTLSAYRSRWRDDEPFDARYARLQQRLGEVETLATPTLMIQGGADGCDEPASSEGRERFFTGGYRRVVLEGIGHFPPREAAEVVAEAVLEHLS
jgi:pimeloyl-ACP methyl ester carboxylesterase